jgi:hypothetical protein
MRAARSLGLVMVRGDLVLRVFGREDGGWGFKVLRDSYVLENPIKDAEYGWVIRQD